MNILRSESKNTTPNKKSNDKGWGSCNNSFGAEDSFDRVSKPENSATQPDVADTPRTRFSGGFDRNS